jgi:hypothetical protein
LRFNRTTNLDRFLVLEAGTTILHSTTDYGPDGAQIFRTGRKYVLTARRALLPGSATITIPAVSYRPGTGYNQPLPGTISEFAQRGDGLSNTGFATGTGTQFQTTTGAGSQLDPLHVRGMIAFDSGPMAGQLRQIRQFVGGAPVVIELDHFAVFRGVTAGGPFAVGERVVQLTSGASGLVLASNADYLAIDVDSPEINPFTSAFGIIGLTSGAGFTINATIQQPTTAGVAAWRFQNWTDDLSVVVTNDAAPTGGRAGMLDELGFERNVSRASAEGDESYRLRVGNPADVVSPNAIRRTANQILAPYKSACCFRQVGSRLLPGMFYDAGSSANVPQNPAVNYAYDLPLTAQNRNKVALDLAHFRGYFRLGVPPLNLGEYGCAYDRGNTNAYDVRFPAGNFFDGYPVGNRRVWAAIWSAVDRARMAGVRWEMYVENIGCF